MLSEEKAGELSLLLQLLFNLSIELSSRRKQISFVFSWFIIHSSPKDRDFYLPFKKDTSFFQLQLDIFFLKIQHLHFYMRAKISGTWTDSYWVEYGFGFRLAECLCIGVSITALFVQWNFWRKEGNKQFCYGFFLRSCTLFPKFLGFSSTVNSAHTNNYRVKLLQTTGPDLMCN